LVHRKSLGLETRCCHVWAIAWSRGLNLNFLMYKNGWGCSSVVEWSSGFGPQYEPNQNKTKSKRNEYNKTQ
jgi:hypothetical protein